MLRTSGHSARHPAASAAHYEEVRLALSRATTKIEFQRVLCVWLRLALALTSRQVALAVGWSPSSVRRVQARYLKEGIDCLWGRARGGRRHAYLSWDREKTILDKFRRQTRRGGRIYPDAVRSALELSIGRRLASSTVYRIIGRHGLRRFLAGSRSS
ncbi:MAG: helix-turn-helix domain-containing protein [Candidatus Sulfotelmatobacter sp.]